VILVLLVSQITFSALLMRYSATHVDVNLPRFRASVAVLATEAMKLPICIVAVTVIAGGPRGFFELMRAELPKYQTLMCMVPALAFTLQSNLLFIATANLETPTFQVAYQSKTLFTALFSVCLLGRRLRASQWCALLFLFIGTVLAADLAGPSAASSKKGSHTSTTESAAKGLTACFSAAMLSAFSSVFFEKVLKGHARADGGNRGGSDGSVRGGILPDTGGAAAPVAVTHSRSDDIAESASLWVRNIQLGLFALPLAAGAAVYKDGGHLAKHGWLTGFDWVVWSVVLTNGIGGLLVAATMKYADNIIKCFATALAIVSGTLLSVPIFGFELSQLFLVGLLCTLCATVLYAWAPSHPPAGDAEEGVALTAAIMEGDKESDKESYKDDERSADEPEEPEEGDKGAPSASA